MLFQSLTFVEAPESSFNIPITVLIDMYAKNMFKARFSQLLLQFKVNFLPDRMIWLIAVTVTQCS